MTPPLRRGHPLPAPQLFAVPGQPCATWAPLTPAGSRSARPWASARPHPSTVQRTPWVSPTGSRCGSFGLLAGSGESAAHGKGPTWQPPRCLWALERPRAAWKGAAADAPPTRAPTHVRTELNGLHRHGQLPLRDVLHHQRWRGPPAFPHAGRVGHLPSLLHDPGWARSHAAAADVPRSAAGS